MLSDYQELVSQAVRDDSGRITPDDIASAIGLALARYSLDRPRLVVEDLAPNGSSSLPLPLLWEADFSQVCAVEYRIGEFPPSMVDNDEYGLYQYPMGWVLRFAFTPDAPVRITYGISHVLNDADDTIPAKHREAVACWAAAYCFDQLAGFYAGATDNTLQADKVDRGTQAKDFAQRAVTLRKRYINELGLEDKKSAAAGVVVDMDLKSSLGRDRLTHPNRFR